MEIPSQVMVRLNWDAVERTPASHVNQVLSQAGPPLGNGIPDGIYVSLGSIAPPVMPQDDAGRAARIAELNGSDIDVAVRTVACT